MDRVVIGATGPADRLVADGLADLAPMFEALRGHVLIVGGLMARIWLHLRPVAGVPLRPTADVDVGVDSKGLGLTADSEKVRPLLESLDYRAKTGDEGFRFEKQLTEGVVLVDLFVAKGASRHRPPVLEKGVATLAAPGLAYAIKRGPVFVEVEWVDGERTSVVEVPVPTLDSAFILKAALADSGVRTRPDRRERDTVDAVMLAAACLRDDAAMAELRAGIGESREARAAVRWLEEHLSGPGTAAARRVARYLEREHEYPGGGEWAAETASALGRRLKP